MYRSSALVGLTITMVAVAVACGSASDESGVDDARIGAVTSGEPFPAARCEANRAAGTVTYLTGFDYAAAASIVDVVVAEQSGYFDELCLDVEVRAGLSTSNYPLVASGNAQLASGGSFSEVIAYALASDTNFVVTAVEGRTPIDALIVKQGGAESLEDLRGSTIGVKEKLPTSIDVMLRQAGLVEGEDFDTVPLNGFDPVAHFEIERIDAMPGWKSNEPGALRRAGVEFQLFDPIEAGVPGSFGVIFANSDFVAGHPTAAQDFVRATMRGLADALANPEAAANTAVELLNSTGNAFFLSPDGEVFRWQTEAVLIVDATPASIGVGVPDRLALQAELDAYAATGLFGEGAQPAADASLRNDIIDAIYDSDNVVIWPSRP